ncbi:Uncharacterized protein APZ42_023080 [Daphnia magna]|uniref:Uncharacterized protein n=1 Tax=Daphnia magna TaxID=35525 RepID=A0A164V8J5_9CRUS|nr:Uncharacterized protein APZ42_023080 [Daphnia magna]
MNRQKNNCKVNDRTPSTKGHTHSRTNVDKTQLFNTNVNSSLRDVKTFPPPRRTVPAHE